MEATKVSYDRGLNKEDVVHIYYTIEYYLAIRKDEILPFVTCMDLKNIRLNQMNQSEKAKNPMILLIRGI